MHLVTCTWLHTQWLRAPGYTHLVTRTWLHALGYMYLVTRTWLHTLGYTHLITHTWLHAPGYVHLVTHTVVTCTWLHAPGYTHSGYVYLVTCTWLRAPGYMHLLQPQYSLSGLTVSTTIATLMPKLLQYPPQCTPGLTLCVTMPTVPILCLCVSTLLTLFCVAVATLCYHANHTCAKSILRYKVSIPTIHYSHPYIVRPHPPGAVVPGAESDAVLFLC